MQNERPTRHFLSHQGARHRSAFSPLQHRPSRAVGREPPGRTSKPPPPPLPHQSVLGNSDPLASGPALSRPEHLWSNAGEKDLEWASAWPAACALLRPHGSGWSALNSGSAPGPGQSTSEPSPPRRVLSLCSKPPPHLCLAGPPRGGDSGSQPLGRAPSQHHARPLARASTQTGVPGRPRSHTTWFPHTGLWAIQGMPFVDMQNFYEYSFL